MVVVSLLFVSALEPTVAHERLVRFNGRVQWIAGQLMAVHPASGYSVTVDLVGSLRTSTQAASPAAAAPS